MLQKYSSLHHDFIEKIKLSFVLSVSYLCTFAVICLNICCEKLDCYFGSERTEMLHNCLGIQTIFQRIERPRSNLQSLVDFKNSETSKMPCPFTGPKMFCACPNFLSQPKNLTVCSASSKTFVPAQKTILLNANHLFVWHKMFVTATICK